MNRVVPVALLALTLWPWMGCAASDRDVHQARSSGYATDFAIVYGEALAVVTKLYPHLIENASAGTIRTKWHPIRIRDNQQSSQGGVVGDQTNPAQTGSPEQSTGAFRTTTLGAKNYYIRFDVAVIGGNPWRIRIKGHASVHEVGGGVPSPLTGAETPAWLEGRENALRVAIHNRLRRHAVKLKFRAKPEESTHVAGTKTSYGNVPDGATRIVTAVHRAALTRDAAALRQNMIEEFSWSAGGAPNADVAIATWQADSAALTELARILDAGCRADDSGKLVTCPPAYTEEPSYDGYRAGFKLVDGAWKMSFFMNAR